MDEEKEVIAAPLNCYSLRAIGEFAIFKQNCIMCNDTLCAPKVELYCGCNFHLTCLDLIRPSNTCTCGDKIVKQEDDFPECPICMLPIKSEVLKTVCNHVFHRACIRSWNQSEQENRFKCPMCRKDMWHFM